MWFWGRYYNQKRKTETNYTIKFVFMTESTQFSDFFALFTCGGPCHLSSFKQCSGGTYLSLSTGRYGKDGYFWVCVITLSILKSLNTNSSPKLHSAPLSQGVPPPNSGDWMDTMTKWIQTLRGPKILTFGAVWLLTTFLGGMHTTNMHSKWRCVI